MNTRRVIFAVLFVVFLPAFIAGLLAAAVAITVRFGWDMLDALIDWLAEPLP